MPAVNCSSACVKSQNKLNSKPLFLFLDEVAIARGVTGRSSGVRGAEVIENLFYTWVSMTRTESRA